MRALSPVNLHVSFLPLSGAHFCWDGLPLRRIAFALALVACNNPPGPATIALSPAQPLTTDDLEVVFLSESAEPNSKDTVSYDTFWYVDGAMRSDLTGMSVAAAETAKGEVWKVIVTPTDGELDGPPVASEVVIGNTPPLAEVSVDNEAPLSDEDVTATATGTDADGDDLEFAYTWTVEGDTEQLVEGATLLALETVKGQVWTVAAIAKDGESESEPATASVSIENALPVVESVAIDPSDPTESSTLTAQVSATDADADPVGLQYAWWVGGVEVQSGTDSTLTGALFDKHDVVSVVLTPNDGFTDGVAVTSDPTTILNTPPSLTSAALDPQDIYETTTVTCVPSGWSDDDGDPEGYTWAWTVDGVDVGVNAATLDGASFNRDQSVACSVTPNDGEEDGSAVASTPVVVSNTAPVIVDVALSPTSPQEGDTITVALGTTTDDDGDAFTYAYEWTVNGASAGTALNTLSDLYFSKGEVITVTVTPNDGTDDGLPVTSTAITAVNTVPTLSSVTLSPSEVYTDTVATADLDHDQDWTCSVDTHDGAESGPTVAATVRTGPSDINHPGGGLMLVISGGTFDMGCTTGQANCGTGEYPVHTVTLTHDFFLGATEVTQGEYQVVIGSNPSSYPSCGASCPVDHVSWYDVAEFANALSAADGLDNCFACSGGTCTTLGDPYTCTGYRLPTEAEWEFAARAGTDLLYAGSDTLDDVGWHNSNSGYNPHPVAQKEPNAWGLYDMSGNVMEWVWDRYAGYSSSPVSDPAGPQSGSSRVNRGGSWLYNPVSARVAYRQGNNPSDRGYSLGFRLARTVP